MKRRNRRIALPLVGALLTLSLAGCIEDETLINPLDSETDRFFHRYVSLGNSLTAGYMSGGINDSTQHLAYPVRLAAMADADFIVPSLNMPGCPPPLVGVLDTDSAGNTVIEQDRVGGGENDDCALRASPTPEIIQNVAVPGARIADAIDIDRTGNASNPLTTLLLGGMSQLDAARRVQPTLITSWLGNNDALAAALRGDPTLLTPLDTFEFYHDRLASGIAGSGPLGVALITVIDVTLAPVLQPGLYYWAADSLGFAPKPASANCAPTDSAGSPNPLSMNTVSFLAYLDAAIDTISCDPSAEYVLTFAELDVIEDRIDDFNDIITAEATSRNWALVRSTSVLEAELTQAGSGRHNLLRQCEALTNNLTLEQIVTVVTNQCPHSSAPNFFGSLLTYDGIHMSAAAHQVLAEAIALQLNGRYDLEL